MRKLLTFGLLLATAGMGCTTVPSEPPASAVLSGDWQSTNLEDLVVTLMFDEDGILTQVEAERPSDGATALLNPQDATSDVNSNAVAVTVPTDNGSVVYNAALSADENMLAGTLSSVIDLENGVLTIPQGDLDLTRSTSGGGDPCDDVTCNDGETCVDGDCVADDPCEGVTCNDDEACVDGVCVVDDPCEGVTCNDGETCVDGVCVADDPCEGVTCNDGETCVDGVCVDDNAGGGDATAGGELFAANCAACHGSDGSGGAVVADSIRDSDAATVNGALMMDGHPSPEVSDEDVDNMVAFLSDQ